MIRPATWSAASQTSVEKTVPLPVPSAVSYDLLLAFFLFFLIPGLLYRVRLLLRSLDLDRQYVVASPFVPVRSLPEVLHSPVYSLASSFVALQPADVKELVLMMPLDLEAASANAFLLNTLHQRIWRRPQPSIV